MGRVAGGIVSLWPGRIRLETEMPLALTSAPSVTPLRYTIPASASPATTVYVVDVEPPLVDDTRFEAAGTVPPAGMTSESPGWITVATVIEFACSRADNRTPERDAIPASASPATTVYVADVEPPLVDDAGFEAAGIVAPAGITSVSPGWITVATVIELACSNAARRTP